MQLLRIATRWPKLGFALDAHGGAVAQGVVGVGDEAGAGGEAAGEFDGLAEVAADDDARRASPGCRRSAWRSAGRRSG